VDNHSLNHGNKEHNDVNNSFQAGAIGIGIGKFPKEFERQWSELVDKRFALILLASFVIHFLTAFYFAINPPSDQLSSKEIRKIQEQYVDLVLKEPIKKVEEFPEEFVVTEKAVEKEESEGGETSVGKDKRAATSEMKGGTAEARKAQYDAGEVQRRRTREQISEEVSSKGLLGVLSGSGSAATGEGVADLLGEVESGEGNLDNVFSQLDGIKVADGSSGGGAGGTTGTGGGKGVKGSRTTSGGGIDALVSGGGAAKSTSVQRKGSLVVSSISAVEDEKGMKSDSRNSDDVSEIVNNHNAAIQYCYQRELKRDPNLKGKLVVRFTIAPSGRVTDVNVVSSTLNNQRVERCVVSRIQRWDDFGAIDPSKGDAVFRQVYTFGY